MKQKQGYFHKVRKLEVAKKDLYLQNKEKEALLSEGEEESPEGIEELWGSRWENLTCPV